VTARNWAGETQCRTTVVGPVQYVPPPPPPPTCPTPPTPTQNIARQLVETPFLFAENNTQTGSVNPQLDAIVQYLREVPDTTLQIDGYANEGGADESHRDVNRLISRQRVESVVRYLLSHGVAREHLIYNENSYHGRQPSTPLIDADDPRNRSVVFHISTAGSR